MENLQAIADFLNKKYSSISDFNVVVDNNAIKGGFYKMNYMPSLGSAGEYYFHECCYRLNIENNSFEKLAKYADDRIQLNLKWQKNNDEYFAKEHNKEVVYQFDYSAIQI